MTEEVRMFRLISGEEVYCTVSDRSTIGDSKTVTLHKPVIMVPSPEKQDSFSFYPWVPQTKDENIEISVSNVIFEVAPISEIAEGYKQATSPIAMRPQGIIT